MLVNRLASHGEDGTGLLLHRQQRSLVVEELLEVLRRRLGRSLAREGTFW